MTGVPAMEASLATVADAGIDIRHALFDRFFAAYPGRRAVITSLAKAAEALNGETGTVITAE